MLTTYLIDLYKACEAHYRPLVTIENSQSYVFVISSFVLAFAIYLFLKKYSIKKIYRRATAYLKTKRYQEELFKDVYYIPIRVIVTALFFILYGYNFDGIRHFLYTSTHDIISLEQMVQLKGIFGQAIRIIAVAMFIDFGEFCAHLATHKFENLWLFHKMHHRCTSLNSLTKVRFHPVDLYFVIIVKILISIPLITVFEMFYSTSKTQTALRLTIVGAIYFALNHLRHSSIRIHYPRFLSYILISPIMHQVHHSSRPEHYDKNFGTVFALWDWAYGSIYIPEKDEYFKFGLAEERNQIMSIWKELYYPFIELFNKYKNNWFSNNKPTAIKPLIEEKPIRKIS